MGPNFKCSQNHAIRTAALQIGGIQHDTNNSKDDIRKIRRVKK